MLNLKSIRPLGAILQHRLSKEPDFAIPLCYSQDFWQKSPLMFMITAICYLRLTYKLTMFFDALEFWSANFCQATAHETSHPTECRNICGAKFKIKLKSGYDLLTERSAPAVSWVGTINHPSQECLILDSIRDRVNILRWWKKVLNYFNIKCTYLEHIFLLMMFLFKLQFDRASVIREEK